MPDKRIKDKLLATAAITALVGTRVVPTLDELADYPGIVFEQSDDSQDGDLVENYPSGVAEITLECWGRTYQEAKQLSDLVKSTLTLGNWWTAAGTPTIAMVRQTDRTFGGRVQIPGRNAWYYWFENTLAVDYDES